jgi:4-hydroxy-2-oxoheptanedioate aldolase
MIHASRHSFDSKAIAIGVWSIIDSPVVTEIISTSGVDAIYLDLEHGQFSISSLADCIRVASPYCAPFVRIPKVDKELAQKVLDLGAAGIIVPQITSVEQVIDACSAVELAPRGTRGFNPFTRAGDYLGNASAAGYRPGAATVIPIIETMKAVDVIDAIVALPGVEIVYIGVYDLSCAVGMPGKVDHPDVLAAASKIRNSVKTAGKRIAYMVDARRPEDSDIKSMQVLKPDAFLLKQALVTRIAGTI